MKLDCQKDKFRLPEGEHYLNCAYMSPLMKDVEEVGIASIQLKRAPSNISPQDFFDDSDILRNEFSRLINNNEPERIAIMPSVSYGIATIARNTSLNKGHNIVVVGEQFPSNYYSWERLARDNQAHLVVVQPPVDFKHRGKMWNEAILESINDKTAIVALGHVHWADGTLFDLVAIRKKARTVGAKLIIDGTQSVGALPFDIQEIQPDALICAGYKWLMGPYSIALGWFGPSFDQGIPLEENWINRKNSENFAGLVNYEPDYQPGALRYDSGEHSNFILVPMMVRALQQLNNWGVENIQNYCKSISKDTITKLKENGFLVEDEAWRGGHLFGIRVPEGMDFKILKESLERNKISVSVRGSAIRVAVNIYNDESDLQKLFKSCMEAIK